MDRFEPVVKRNAATVSIVVASMAALVSCADVIDIPERTYDGESAKVSDACEEPIGVRIVQQTGPWGEAYYAGIHDYLREIEEQGVLGSSCDLDIQTLQAASRTEAGQAYQKWRTEDGWSNVNVVFPFMPDQTDEVLSYSDEDERVVITGSPLARFATPVSVSKSVKITEVTATFQSADFSVQIDARAMPYSFIATPDVSTLTRLAVYDLLIFGSRRIAFFHGSEDLYTDRVVAGKTMAASISSPIGRDLLVQDAEDPAMLKQQVLSYFQKELDHKDANPGYEPVDWVFCATYGNTLTIAQALAQLESETGHHVGMVTYGDGLDEMTASACDSTCEGRVFGIFGIDTYEGTSAGAEEARGLHDKWRARDAEAGAPADASYRSMFYMRGVAAATLWRLGMEALVRDGRRPTSQALKQSLEALQQRPMRDLTGDVSLSPEDHRPSSKGWVYYVTNEKKLAFMPPSRSIAMENEWLGW